jgi:hypothetical protein
MKQTLTRIIRNVKSIKGNSLAEFATTTALMATLAATAAPKLSEMSEGTKAEKSRNEIDKIIKQAGQFYQDMADTEGRGRFPNQSKFNSPVGPSYTNAGGSSSLTATAIGNSKTHTDNIMKDLGLFMQEGNDADGNPLGLTDGWQNYSDEPINQWVSVFGGYAGSNAKITQAGTDNEWLALFGDEVLGSTFQDGHYVYTVVAGGGTGSDVYPPVVYVVDVENAVDFNNVLEP